MVGVKTDVAAFDPIGAEPCLDHRELGRAVAIGAVDLRVHLPVEAEDRIGADAIVEPQPLSNFGGVETVAGGGHHHAPPLGLVAGDRGARAGADVVGQRGGSETVDQRG